MDREKVAIIISTVMRGIRSPSLAHATIDKRYSLSMMPRASFADLLDRALRARGSAPQELYRYRAV